MSEPKKHSRSGAKKAFPESEGRFRSLIEHSHDAITLITAEGRILYDSPSVIRVLGYTSVERLGRKVAEFVHPGDRRDFEVGFDTFVREPGTIMEYRGRFVHKDGRPRWIEGVRSNLLQDPAVRAIVVNYRDISDRKHAEEALRASEAKYRSLIDATYDLVWAVDAEGRVTFINNAAQRIHGRDPNDILGHPFLELIAPRDRARVQAAFLAAVSSSEGMHDCECRGLHSDGTVRFLAVKSVLLRDNEGRIAGLFGAAQDVSELKRAEEALRKSEEHFRRIVDTANEGIWALDADMRITFVNRQVTAMLGYPAQDMLGRPLADFIFEEDLPDHELQLEQRRRGLSGHYERRLRRKDGNVLWGAVSSTSVRDIDGRFLGSFAMLTDITARREDESRLAALGAQLMHTSRLATLGQLAAGIAHEVNQPLCTILNFANACKNLLSNPTPDLAKLHEWSEAIAAAAARSGDIVRRVLGFARKDKAERETVSVKRLLTDAMLLVRHEAKTQKVTLRQEISGEELTVWAEPAQIVQVLVNLLRNAIEALASVPRRDGYVAVEARRAGSVVCVSVSDNGSGQDAAGLSKMFQAFFTTKSQGLGLGLSISKTIVEDHGGRIWAESGEGRGLTVHFALPTGKDEPNHAPGQNGLCG